MFERRGPFSIGYQRGHVPDNRGKSCKRRQRVYSPWYDKVVWRCASYGRMTRATGLFFRPRRQLSPVSPPAARPRRMPRGPGFFQRMMRPIEGRVPLSLPSMERQRPGRT